MTVKNQIVRSLVRDSINQALKRNGKILDYNINDFTSAYECLLSAIESYFKSFKTSGLTVRLNPIEKFNKISERNGIKYSQALFTVNASVLGNANLANTEKLLTKCAINASKAFVRSLSKGSYGVRLLKVARLPNNAPITCSASVMIIADALRDADAMLNPAISFDCVKDGDAYAMCFTLKILS